jgi:DNA (cytosine-5)-methyltransferase 1
MTPTLDTRPDPGGGLVRGDARRLPLTFGSLFAGIGGVDLGFERAGLECVWQVEIDPFARRVLEKHWPHVRRHDDVRTFPPSNPDEWRCDVIAGGFPCQDISFAGKGAGLSGERSGLWFEYARIIRELRPRYVLVENVSALLVRGLDSVLGTLASLGFDAEWECLPAAAFGAPQIRDQVFLLAYTDRNGWLLNSHERYSRQVGRTSSQASRKGPSETSPLASRCDGFPEWTAPHEAGSIDESHLRTMAEWFGVSEHWLSEPNLERVANGFPTELDSHRLRTIGNAIVPQIAEWIGRRIIEAAS